MNAPEKAAVNELKNETPEALQAKIAQLEQENQFLQRQLRSAATMISLGELVSTTTHEFNNVLMTVINYAELGLRNPDPEKRDWAFTTIRDAGRRAAKITENILGMARNRSNAKEPTNLVQLVESSLLLLNREMTKYHVAVETDFEPDLPEVLVLGNQIQQVLLNLLINARQAMPDGGRLILRLKMDDTVGMVAMIVRDFGTGIPQDVLPHIFEPFYSTKKGPDESGKGGSGLGLSSCREIIEDHGGKIRVNSSVGKGTEFTIWLPLAKPKAPAKKAAKASEKAPATKSKPVKKATRKAE